MKKLFAALAVLMMLLLVGCGGSTQTSASKSMTDSLSGTYVGKNGSALTLFPDGTSEYYYMIYSSMDYDKGAGNWNYKDGTLTWMYNDKPVTATINEQSALSFTLEQADGWNREQFIKASDTAKNRSVDEYQELLRNTLNRPEMDNYDPALNQEYTIESFDFTVPFYYWKASSQTESNVQFAAESYKNSSTFATAYLNIEVADSGTNISNKDFEEKSLELWEKAFCPSDSSNTISQAPAKIEANGLPGVQGTFVINFDGYTSQHNATLFFDETSQKILILQLVTTDGTIFKYDSDFAKIVNSVTLTERQTTSSSSSDSNGGGRTESSSVTTSSNGVTPELKAFLDSYEAYMDQYIAFMQKYENSDDTYSMLYDYLDMMQQYADFTEKLDQYDTDKMSAVDSAYYLEVTTRVAKKLYAAAIQ